MTDEEYESLKKRLTEDFWAYVGHKVVAMGMLALEWAFKALGAAWPIVLAWLRKNGYFDV